MKQERKDLLRKIVLLSFLVMIVLGFSVPLLQLDPNQAAQNLPEPRLCQTDADCYLTCDTGPVPVFCSQNLCQQNACNEYALYPFKETPLSFRLSVLLEGKHLDLQNRSNQNNFFTIFNDGVVTIFTSRLTLNEVLQKANLRLDSSCLYTSPQSYCQGNGKTLVVTVNRNESLQFGDYIPREGDIIEIVYS